MQLVNVGFRNGPEAWLYPTSTTLERGRVNVVLGATRAGKTTLLRLLAGLERPSSGELLHEGRDLTAVPLRRRSVAMVYQQFINYPSLSVYENIASPLRVAGASDDTVQSQVTALAELLRLTPVLARLPAQLSGGQQQRVALARALARDAELLLLDEPLVNLDYKLREELRGELTQIFAQRRATVVYTTTDPQEALQLGGHVHVLHEGRLLQSGDTLEVFHRPATLAVARAFSDPPLNTFPCRIETDGATLRLPDGSLLRARQALRASLAAAATLALRPHQLTLVPHGGAQCSLTGTVQLAEISGSQTYLHLGVGDSPLIAQVPGVHRLAIGERCTLYFSPEDLLCFDAAEARLPVDH